MCGAEPQEAHGYSVTYLFRTAGQVIGVSLSGALLQAVLAAKLKERITGPNAAEVCHCAMQHSNTNADRIVYRLLRVFGEPYCNTLREFSNKPVL